MFRCLASVALQSVLVCASEALELKVESFEMEMVVEEVVVMVEVRLVTWEVEVVVIMGVTLQCLDQLGQPLGHTHSPPG